MPPDTSSFRALRVRKASLHLLTFNPPAQKYLPTPLLESHPDTKSSILLSNYESDHKDGQSAAETSLGRHMVYTC